MIATVYGDMAKHEQCDEIKNLLKFILNAFLEHVEFRRRNHLPLVNVGRLVLGVGYRLQKLAVSNHEQS